MIEATKVFTSFGSLYAAVKHKHGEHHLYLGRVPDTVFVRWEDGMFIERHDNSVALFDKRERKVVEITFLTEEEEEEDNG